MLGYHVAPQSCYLQEKGDLSPAVAPDQEPCADTEPSLWEQEVGEDRPDYSQSKREGVHGYAG